MRTNHSEPKGLYAKYVVLKHKGHGNPDVQAQGIYGSKDFGCKNLWLKDTRGFVLSPEKDDDYGHASRMALITYAKNIKKGNLSLYNDILDWLGELERVMHGPC